MQIVLKITLNYTLWITGIFYVSLKFWTQNLKIRDVFLVAWVRNNVLFRNEYTSILIYVNIYGLR